MNWFVLDTSVLVHLARKPEVFQSIVVEHKLDSRDARIAISVVSIAELQVLAKHNKWSDKKLNSVIDYLQTMNIVDITESDFELLDHYVSIELYAKKPNSGSAHKMGKNDIWIAASAKLLGATLITFDKDFDFLDGKMLSVKCYTMENK
jgi:tRNA(fMet)-specific endonuclease VapC